MNALDCGPKDQIFSHIDLRGVARHFNASAMTRAVLMGQVKPMPVVCDLYQELIDHTMAHGGIEEAHIENVAETSEHPVLLVEFADGESLLVDGNHRIIWRWRHGLRNVKALVFKPGQWEPFLVENMPEQVSIACLLNVIAGNPAKPTEKVPHA